MEIHSCKFKKWTVKEPESFCSTCTVVYKKLACGQLYATGFLCHIQDIINDGNIRLYLTKKLYIIFDN